MGFQTEPLEEEIEKLKQHLKEMMDTNLSLIEENKQKVLQLKEAESVISELIDKTEYGVNQWQKAYSPDEETKAQKAIARAKEYIRR